MPAGLAKMLINPSRTSSEDIFLRRRSLPQFLVADKVWILFVAVKVVLQVSDSYNKTGLHSGNEDPDLSVGGHILRHLLSDRELPLPIRVFRQSTYTSTFTQITQISTVSRYF